MGVEGSIRGIDCRNADWGGEWYRWGERLAAVVREVKLMGRRLDGVNCGVSMGGRRSDEDTLTWARGR
jgi:hypothetical protein